MTAQSEKKRKQRERFLTRQLRELQRKERVAWTAYQHQATVGTDQSETDALFTVWEKAYDDLSRFENRIS